MTGVRACSRRRRSSSAALAAGAHGCTAASCSSASTSEAVLRWANSTMTTNGHTTSRRVTVIAFVAVDGGTAAGVVSSSAAVTDAAQLGDLVRGGRGARRATPARPATPLPLPEPDRRRPDLGRPGRGDLDRGLRARSPTGWPRCSPARSGSTASPATSSPPIWLGTSTGVRRRWVQPTGSVELNAKTPDLAGSAWTGASTADFTDVDVVALAAEAARRLDWGRRRVALPAGRYETLLPPSAVADLMIYLAWSMDGRPAQEGRSALAGPDGPRIGERLTDLPLTLASDPAAPGPGVRAVPDRDPLRRRDQRVRQRRADPAGRVGARRRDRRAGLLPGRGRRVRHRVHPRRGQPAAHRRLRRLDRGPGRAAPSAGCC